MSSDDVRATPPPSAQRVVTSVPEPPWEPLKRCEVFDRVDARALETRRRRARYVHQLRVAAQQGIAGGESAAAAAAAADQASGQVSGAASDTEEFPATPVPAPTTAASGAAGTSAGTGSSAASTLANIGQRKSGGDKASHADPMAGASPSTSAASSPAAGTAKTAVAGDGKSPASSASPPPLGDSGDGCVGIPNPAHIQEHFAAGGRLAIADAQAIIRAATEILRAEPNVLRLAGPLTVCGDVHGQFYDVLNIFKLGGDPDTTQYLFLGDYVDRGSFSTEIVLTLFARKIVRPYALWMLRGNHECSYLTSYFNFKQECLHKYDTETYELFLAAFDCLPLAAVVNGEFLCLHGGLSPFIRTVEDIDTIDRFRDPPQRGPMCDLLWSDPMEDEEEELCPDALFLHNELRGCSYVYTHTAACDFLQRNGLAALIRAHEAQEEGFRMYRKVPATGMPATICVFSAPNYCEFNNLAAILFVDGRQLQVRQFCSSPQPYCLPQFMNAFTWSMPFVFEKLDHVLADVWESTEDDPNEVPVPCDRISVYKSKHRSPVTSSQSVSTAPRGGGSSTRGLATTGTEPTSDLAQRIAAAGMEARARRAAAAEAAAGGECAAGAGPPQPGTDVAHTVPEAELARAAAHVMSVLAAAMSRCLLPRVLRRRGGVMRIKVLAVVRFIRILKALRGTD